MSINPILKSDLPILIAYATRSGSTREVAEAVAATLAENGIKNDLKAARAVNTLAGYQAVILGAPLYMFHWQRDALNFLSRLHADLAQRPVAIFALGPFHDEEKELQSARQQLDKELLIYPWLKPVEIQVFAGKYDPAKLSFPFNLLMVFPGNPMKKLPPSDERNWPQIKAWAAGLPDKYKQKIG